MLHFLIARLQTVQPLHDFQTCHHQNLKPDCHPHLHNHDRSEHKKRKEKTTPFGANLMRSQVLERAAQYSENNIAAFSQQLMKIICCQP